MKVCAKCKREIHQLEHYFIMTEMFADKTITERFIHKRCWEETPRAMAMRMVNKAMGIMNKAERKIDGDGGREQVVDIK